MVSHSVFRLSYEVYVQQLENHRIDYMVGCVPPSSPSLCQREADRHMQVSCFFSLVPFHHERLVFLNPSNEMNEVGVCS